MIFISNKYTHWYYNIITRAQSRTLTGYSERHHIIPKCLGGNDTNDNLVRLTAREHFICHRLLVRMVEQGLRGKLSLAAAAMWRKAKNQSRDYVFHSRTYDTLKRQASEYLSELNRQKWAAARDGTGPAMGPKKGKSYPKNSKVISDEQRRQQSEYMKDVWAKRKAAKCSGSESY